MFFLALVLSARLTPGTLCNAQDPDFDGYRYPAHVAHCRRNVSAATKSAVAKAYHIPRSDWRMYEFDHRVPLALGGSNSVLNIWPEPIADAKRKDVLEVRLYRLLYSGQISQADAVERVLAGK